MKKFLSAAILALICSASVYTQGVYAQGVQRNLYMIDANGNILTLKSPLLGGSINITMPTEGGTLVTNTSTGGQTVTGGMTISGGATLNGGTEIGTSLTLTDGAYTRWYNAAGTFYTQLGAAAGQGVNISYLWPTTAPNSGDVLVTNGSGQLSWTAVPGITLTPTYDNATLGNTTTPTQGQLIIYDGDAAPNGFAGTLLTDDLTQARTWTFPDLDGEVTLMGNTFNGNNQLVKLDGTGKLTAGMLPSGTMSVATPYVVGDLVYASSTSAFSKLGIGATGQILTVSAGLPAWSSDAVVGSAATSGSVTLYPNDAEYQKIVGTAGTTNRTYTLPDVPDAFFVMTEGGQTINGDKSFTNFGTPSTSPAVTSGNVIVDAASTNNVSLSPTGNITITSITNGFSGQRLRLYNNSAHKMTLQNSNTATANTIKTLANNDVVLHQYGAAEFIFDGTQWVSASNLAYNVTGQIGGTIFGVKGIAQTVQGSALTNDADLKIAINPNETWEIQGTVTMTTNAASVDGQIGFVVPAGATMKISYIGYKESSSGLSGQASGVATSSGSIEGVTCGSAVTPTIVDFRGIVISGANAGDIQFQFSSNKASPDEAVVQANSYIRGTRVK